MAAEVVSHVVPGTFTPGGPSLGLYLLLTVPIFFYAGYWAFSIRHALAVPLYRRQAFGIGFLVLAIWITLLIFVVTPLNPTGFVYTIAQFGAFYFLFIALFFWIDASILSSRRSDPLLRDTLYWSKVRVPVWVLLIISVAIPIPLVLYVNAVGDPALVAALNAGTLGGPVFSFLMNNLILNFPVAVPILGLVYLPAAALKSKWDVNLRRHLAWFVPSSVVLLLIFFGPASGTSGPAEIVVPLLVLVMGYTLYKSAKSLVPLNIMSSPTKPVEAGSG